MVLWLREGMTPSVFIVNSFNFFCSFLKYFRVGYIKDCLEWPQALIDSFYSTWWCWRLKKRPPPHLNRVAGAYLNKSLVEDCYLRSYFVFDLLVHNSHKRQKISNPVLRITSNLYYNRFRISARFKSCVKSEFWLSSRKTTYFERYFGSIFHCSCANLLRFFYRFLMTRCVFLIYSVLVLFVAIMNSRKKHKMVDKEVTYCRVSLEN